MSQIIIQILQLQDTCHGRRQKKYLLQQQINLNAAKYRISLLRLFAKLNKYKLLSFTIYMCIFFIKVQYDKRIYTTNIRF